MQRVELGPPEHKALSVHDKLELVQAYSVAKACTCVKQQNVTNSTDQ